MTRIVSLFAILLLAVPARAADDAPSYQRNVTALFSRLGCNGGTCHGAVQGQNGFRLSLFAANPTLDHERLLREANGRRRHANVVLPRTNRTTRQLRVSAGQGFVAVSLGAIENDDPH